MLQAIRQIHSVGDSPERIVGDALWPGMAVRGIEAVGLTDGGNGYEMQRSQPNSGHLLICHGGAGEVWCDDQWRPCADGQAYVAPPLRPMGFRTIGSSRWQFAWVFLAAKPGEASPVACSAPTIVAVDPRPMVNAVEGLYLESVGTARRDRLDLWADLILTYARDLATGGEPADPLWRLWADVDARLGEAWSLGRLADSADIRPEALRRLCLRSTGRSPMQQVTHLRMRRAEALLRSTGSKLYVIAKQVGYQNVFAFSTAFSRWKGRPPRLCRTDSAPATDAHKAAS